MSRCDYNLYRTDRNLKLRKRIRNGRITFATLYKTLVILDHITVSIAVIISFVFKILKIQRSMQILTYPLCVLFFVYVVDRDWLAECTRKQVFQLVSSHTGLICMFSCENSACKKKPHIWNISTFWKIKSLMKDMWCWTSVKLVPQVRLETLH